MAECPLLALSGHAALRVGCPLTQSGYRGQSMFWTWLYKISPIRHQVATCYCRLRQSVNLSGGRMLRCDFVAGSEKNELHKPPVTLFGFFRQGLSAQ